MENITRAEIGERTKGVVENEQKQRWVNAIDEHLINGTDEYIGLYSEEEYQEFTEMIGHEKITSDKIIAYTYEATANEPLYKNGERFKFKGQYSIADIQNRIADYGMNLEFPNCFKTTLVVALDNETMVIYSFDLESWGVVCEDCVKSEDPQIIEELEANKDSGHGCGHEDDEHRERFSATLTERTSAEAYFKGDDNW